MVDVDSQPASQNAQRVRTSRKGRVVGVWLSLADYEAFSSIAAAENRKPAALGGILLLDFLKRRRTAPDPPEPGTEGNS